MSIWSYFFNVFINKKPYTLTIKINLSRRAKFPLLNIHNRFNFQCLQVFRINTNSNKNFFI